MLFIEGSIALICHTLNTVSSGYLPPTEKHRIPVVFLSRPAQIPLSEILPSLLIMHSELSYGHPAPITLRKSSDSGITMSKQKTFGPGKENIPPMQLWDASISSGSMRYPARVPRRQGLRRNISPSKCLHLFYSLSVSHTWSCSTWVEVVVIFPKLI